jgi:hypothetical protein
MKEGCTLVILGTTSRDLWVVMEDGDIGDLIIMRKESCQVLDENRVNEWVSWMGSL